MTKAMLFIDGTWLYSHHQTLSEKFGDREFRLDFGKLPSVLLEEVQRGALKLPSLDLVRTYLFGNYPWNVHPMDDASANNRREFFNLLKEEFHYEVEAYPVNFHGKRLRRADRDPEDPFDPRDNRVAIALASSMMYFSALPNAYDVAVVIIGERDYVPMLRTVRRLGKRVILVSIRGACSPDLSDPIDAARVKDSDVIWLDDLLARLKLTYEPQQRQCESPTHKGERMVWTTYVPRKGQRFFCDACRQEYARQKMALAREFSSGDEAGPGGMPGPSGISHREGASENQERIPGKIKKLMRDKGYGFIESEEGRDYFFHYTDIVAGPDFEELAEGLQCDFVIEREPSYGKAGKAQDVDVFDDDDLEDDVEDRDDFGDDDHDDDRDD